MRFQHGILIDTVVRKSFRMQQTVHKLPLRGRIVYTLERMFGMAVLSLKTLLSKNRDDYQYTLEFSCMANILHTMR